MGFRALSTSDGKKKKVFAASLKMMRQLRAYPTVAVIVVLALWITTVQYALDVGRQSCICARNLEDCPDIKHTRTEDPQSPLLSDSTMENDEPAQNVEEGEDTPPLRGDEAVVVQTTSNTPAGNEVKAGKVALIIEYHWDENIPILMRNALKNLSPDWKLQVVTTYHPPHRFITRSIVMVLIWF